MKIRDRIKELRRVSAGTLLPNPKNWRTHPDSQRDAIKGILAEVGYADALIARELEDGSLQLIDGHLRAETTPAQAVPVLVLDVNEVESEKLLALLDPLASLAETNRERLGELVDRMETENESLRNLLDEMIGTAAEDLPEPGKVLNDLPIPELYQVLVQCEDEDEQRDVFEQLVAEGRRCRIVNV